MKEGFRQAMAWLHTWAGLIFGWLLFAIFLTGTLAYFKGEITHWMQPEVPAHAVDDARSVAVAQSYLEQHAPTAARWFIGLPNSRDPGLSVMWQDKVDPGRRGLSHRRPRHHQARHKAQPGQHHPAHRHPLRCRDDKFTRMPVLHRGKKFRNTFAVTLNLEAVSGG